MKNGLLWGKPLRELFYDRKLSTNTYQQLVLLPMIWLISFVVSVTSMMSCTTLWNFQQKVSFYFDCFYNFKNKLLLNFVLYFILNAGNIGITFVVDKTGTR